MLLIDMDPIVYQAAFSCEKRWVKIGENDFLIRQLAGKDYRAYSVEMDGSLHQEFAAYSRKELLAAIQEAIEGELEEYRTVEPVDHALQVAKTVLQSIKNNTGIPEHIGFLTGSNNYRNKLATMKQYKGSRIGKPKPTHYQAVRDYLISSWGAYVCENIEADDAVSMASRVHENSVIVSIDKDLWTVPGNHYLYGRNIEKEKRFSYVSPNQALTSFFRQLIAGDPTDDIGGIPRKGEAAAAKLITEDMTPIEQFDAVVEAYKKHYKEPVEQPHWKLKRFFSLKNREDELTEEEVTELNNLVYDEDCMNIMVDWEYALNENGALLWMMRNNQEPLWSHDFMRSILEEELKS